MSTENGDTATTPAGRWVSRINLSRAAVMESIVWHTQPGVLRCSAFGSLIAVVRSNGRQGEEERWLLRVEGWEWRIGNNPPVFHQAKAFMTRTVAQIEANDIIAGAATWEP
jgi:hypothetical protein